MKIAINEFRNKILKHIDDDIKSSEELVEILGDCNSVIDIENPSEDINIINRKIKTMKTLKNTIIKLSLDLEKEKLDNEALLTVDEKKIFYRLIKTIMFFRWLFTPFRWLIRKMKSIRK